MHINAYTLNFTRIEFVCEVLKWQDTLDTNFTVENEGSNSNNIN